MSGKQKLNRFKENELLNNITEYTDPDSYSGKKGKWSSDVFKNNNPIVLELACGKGEYTLALAEKFPDKNFIGVDIKGARLWVGAKSALVKRLENVHFLRAYIDHLDRFFAQGEVTEIWITFPDPYPNKSRKRLTSSKFLEVYRKVAKPDCTVHLKTDSELLWEFTNETIKSQNLPISDQCEDIYSLRPDDEILTIRTFFEKKHLAENKTIRFISFKLTGRD